MVKGKLLEDASTVPPDSPPESPPGTPPLASSSQGDSPQDQLQAPSSPKEFLPPSPPPQDSPQAPTQQNSAPDSPRVDAKKDSSPSSPTQGSDFDSEAGVVVRRPADRIASAKLREIFQQCDPLNSGRITLARLAEVCRRSPLVSDFFNRLPPVGGVSAMDAILFEGASRARVTMTWPAFQEAYLTRPMEVPLYEGLLLVKKTGALRFFRLFHERLEHYEDVEAASSGSMGRPTIAVADVRGLEVVSSSFHLHLEKEIMKLSTPVSAAECFEPWRHALLTFASATRPLGAKPASPIAPPTSGGKAAAASRGQAPRAKSAGPGRANARPASPSKAGGSSPSKAGGSSPSKAGGSRPASPVRPRAAAKVNTGLDRSFAPPERAPDAEKGEVDLTGCKPRLTTRGSTSLNTALQPSPDFLHEVECSLLRNWVASHDDPPVFQGAIGMSINGVMTPRLAVLFRDRLAAWDKPLDAVHGRRAQFNTPWSEVRSFEKSGDKGIVIYFTYKATVSFLTLVERDQDVWYRMLMRVHDPQKANSIYRPLVDFTEIPEKDPTPNQLPTARTSRKLTALASARLSRSETRRSTVATRASSASLWS